MFNLGIHDAKTNNGYFHTWKENEAGRGAQEVGSCVIKFLDTHLQPEAEDLILWSDSCGGQNRNRIMCVMLHHWLSKQTKLERITLRFLQSGHSFNSYDTDFGLVEKAMNRQQNVFTPLEVLEIMRGCRQSSPFEVIEMSTLDFHSVGNLMKNVTVRGEDGTTKQKVSWLQTHEIVLHRQEPFKLYMNYDVTKEQVSQSPKFIENIV